MIIGHKSRDGEGNREKTIGYAVQLKCPKCGFLVLRIIPKNATADVRRILSTCSCGAEMRCEDLKEVTDQRRGVTAQ